MACQIKHRLIIFYACPNLGSTADSSGGRIWSHGQTALCRIIYSYIYFLRGYLQWREGSTGDDWLRWEWIPTESIYVHQNATFQSGILIYFVSPRLLTSPADILSKYYASCDWWIAPEVLCKWPDTTSFKHTLVVWFCTSVLSRHSNQPKQTTPAGKNSKVQPY